jgi:hypothetical protein
MEVLDHPDPDLGGSDPTPNPNTSFNAPNMDPNAIPNQPSNTFATPNSPAPNFNGKTTVDTASLDAFSSFVTNNLTPPLQALKSQLLSVQVEPGSFYQADYIRSYVNGTGAATGLSYQFTKVAEDLIDGLVGISSGIRQLSKLYSSTEDLNTADASKLENDMSTSFANASGAFNALANDSQTPSGTGGG